MERSSSGGVSVSDPGGALPGQPRKRKKQVNEHCIELFSSFREAFDFLRKERHCLIQAATIDGLERLRSGQKLLKMNVGRSLPFA